MSNISSDTIFHFTNFVSLKNILINDFIPHFCLETYHFVEQDVYAKVYIPMICFCDIPLGNIKDHIHFYGNYGIGMKKKWAQKNKLNPVFYIDENSDLLEYMSLLLTQFEKTVVDKQHINAVDMNVLFQYCKMFDGNMERHGKKFKRRFYDEREWRYIPNIKLFKNESVIFEEDYIEPIKSKLNSLMLRFRLEYDPEDINYIIIENESKRNHTLKMIDRIGGNMSDEKKRVLCSKIISSEQIFKDF